MNSGAWGEEQACRYLEKKKYHILERNFHCRFGEIDLIAKQGGFTIFVEVKTRKNGNFALPREHVNAAKQHRLILTAQYWLQQHPEAEQPRFDVVEVYGMQGEQPVKIIHLENAFEG